MSALTVTDGVFGVRGTSCPSTNYKVVDYFRTVDFSIVQPADNKNYALIPIPKGFVVDKIAVEQTEVTAASTALTFKVKSDDTIQLGGTFTLSATAASMIRQCDPASSTAAYAAATSGGAVTSAISIPASKFFSAADTLCVCIPDLSSGAGSPVNKGKFTVHMIGYQTFGESLSDVAADTPAWAVGQSDADAAGNKSGGDPMFRQPQYS